MRLSLRGKLLIALGLLLTVTIAVTSRMSVGTAHRDRVAGFELRAELTSRALAAALVTPIWEYDVVQGVAALQGIRDDPDFVAARVLDDQGLVFCEVRANAASVADPKLDDPQAVLRVEEGVTPSIPPGSAPVGHLTAWFSKDRLRAELRRDVGFALLEGALALLVTLAAVAIALRRFTSPLERLTTLIEQRGAGDLSGTVDPRFIERTDEVGAVARAIEVDQQQRRDEARLLQITTAMAGTLELDELLEAITSAAADLAGAERATFFLYDPEADELRARVAQGAERKLLAVKPGEGIAGHAFQERGVVSIRSARDDPRFAERVDATTGFVTTSVVAVAVATEAGERLGVLQVLNRRKGGEFTLRERERLRSLSAQAAVALESANLFAQVVQLNKDLEQEKAVLEELNRAGGRFVPFEFLEILGRSTLPEVRKGDSVQRDMTVFFSDVRSFTSIIEGLTPREATRFINEYLGHMEAPIHDHNGFVDAYLGDAIMALFRDAEQAVRAGVESLCELQRYNLERVARGEAAIRIGIGINSGAATLGVIGGTDRLKCGVQGDCVNLAARIEGMTKLYGAGLLIGEDTHQRLPDPERFALRVVDRVMVKGRSQPTTIYEVLDGIPGPERAARLATLEAFDQGRARFCAGDPAGALEAFEDVLARDPEDRAAALFVTRCREHLERGVPDDWNGVVRLVSK